MGGCGVDGDTTSRLDAVEGTLITMAKHGDPASDNGRPANTTYDHSKTKDVSDAGGGRHSGEDKGGQGSGEEQGGKDEK
jgi:hypothetical protein